MLTKEQLQRIDEISHRLNRVTPGPWRNTIRRESSKQVMKAIDAVGGVGVSRCSESVVNTDGKPTEENVICWMGPAAGVSGDDRIDAQFIAHAREDVEWLIGLVKALHS